jgi:hypothetical protein
VNKIKKKTKNKPKNEKVTNQTKQRKKGMEAETKKRRKENDMHAQNLAGFESCWVKITSLPQQKINKPLESHLLHM